uniref:Uncharacterized protein n=1 Tax=Magallana gigas TaxID=29159 RepID=K1RB13_MAGGI
MTALSRAPTVQEFAQFLLNFEGNELVESPRKTLGHTFFENQVLRVTIERIRRDIGWLREIHRSDGEFADPPASLTRRYEMYITCLSKYSDLVKDMNRMINGKERFESAMYICIFDQQRPRSSVKVDNYLCFSSVDSVPA